MVFYCRCFSFDDDKTTKHGSRTRTRSASNLAGKPNNLKLFTFDEIKVATNNFSNSWKIGEGRHGSVYKGMINSLENPSDKIPVAVNYAKGVNKGYQDWLGEFDVLGMFDHPNLVKLVGYCMEDNERGKQMILVYKYMINGSVRDHLCTKSETPLSWTMRLKVAHDAALALTYLHEGLDFEIVYRDFNSSKLLLDDQWNAMLSDVWVALIGSQGGDSVGPMVYGPPEYIFTGQMSSMSDVWSYGVFLYELITGRQPLDKSRPQNEQKLLEWVKPYVQSKNLEPIIDPRLEGTWSMKSAHALVTIASFCLKENPRSRIKMSEVLELFKGLIGVPPQVLSNPAPLEVPAPTSLVPVKQRSKLFKSLSTKVCCSVCLAPTK